MVLPFANIGGDPEQDYFVDGVTESLTTDLSRISGAFVIARNTAFTFKGKAVDVKKLGRELNVRYVLEGSVQRGGNRLRVNVQLIDAETGNHLWAERFDKPVADLFDMQDEIVSRLANALDAELIAAEARRAESSLHPDAMDLVFPGQGLVEQGADPRLHGASARFFRAGHGARSRKCRGHGRFGAGRCAIGAALMTDDWSARFASAEATLTKALSLAPNHAVAHLVLGIVQMFTNRAAQGIAECEHALALDRNLATAHALIGFAKYFLGRGEETEAHVNEALRLSPRDIFAYRGCCGSASPRCSSVPMPKRSSGCAGASTQTAIIPSRISFSRLHWRGSASWTKRGPPCKRDLRSIRLSPSAAIGAPTHRATIQPSLPGASASMRACGWPGCRKGEAASDGGRGATRPKLLAAGLALRAIA